MLSLSGARARASAMPGGLRRRSNLDPNEFDIRVRAISRESRDRSAACKMEGQDSPSVVKNEQWTAISLTHVEYTKGKNDL